MPETGMPQDNFVVVPKGGKNVVWLDGVKSAVSFTHDAKISVETVTKKNLSKIAESITRFHSNGVGIQTMAEYQKQLWARMLYINDHHPGQMLAITGQAPGWGKLKVSAGGKSYQAEVGVSKQSFIDLSFRFLRHTGAKAGEFVADTIHKPEYAEDFVATLNWIYGPQANIIFDLHDAEWVTVPTAPSQPIGKDYFLNTIAAKRSTADITVYLVGTWGGGSSGHSRGTYFNGEGIAVITDNPKQDEIPDGINVFTLTMAHEILHYLREKRSFSGHHDRDKVLLSNKIQTLRIDKQLVMDINPP